MSALLMLLRGAWPYLLCAGLASAGTGWGISKLDSASYERLQATYAEAQAKWSASNAQAQAAAKNVLQTQMDALQQHEKANADKILYWQQQTAGAESRWRADHERLQQLAAQGPPAGTGGGHLSQAGHQSGAPAACSPSGTDQVTEIAADLAGEDELNADQLDALIAELLPQL